MVSGIGGIDINSVYFNGCGGGGGLNLDVIRLNICFLKFGKVVFIFVIL